MCPQGPSKIVIKRLLFYTWEIPREKTSLLEFLGRVTYFNDLTYIDFRILEPKYVCEGAWG